MNYFSLYNQKNVYIPNNSLTFSVSVYIRILGVDELYLKTALLGLWLGDKSNLICYAI